METIVGVAIKMHGGSVVSLPRPARHHDVVAELARRGYEQGPAPDGAHDLDGQGFVTSEGRFVTRMEAAAIAIATGQVPALKWPPRELYCTDMW